MPAPVNQQQSDDMSGTLSYEEYAFRGRDGHAVPRLLPAGVGQIMDEAVIDGATQGGLIPGQEIFPEGGDIVSRQSANGVLSSLFGHALVILETYIRSDGSRAALVAGNNQLYIEERPAGVFATSLAAVTLPGGVSTVNTSKVLTQRVGSNIYIVDSNNPLMVLSVDDLTYTASKISAFAPAATAPTVAPANITVDALNATNPVQTPPNTEATSWSTDTLTTPSGATTFPPSATWSSAFNGTFYDAGPRIARVRTATPWRWIPATTRTITVSTPALTSSETTWSSTRLGVAAAAFLGTATSRTMAYGRTWIVSGRGSPSRIRFRISLTPRRRSRTTVAASSLA